MAVQRASRAGVAAGAFLAIATAPANALIQRTFVASAGIDTNPCTIAAPCRSFAAAILQTQVGGEILVKDSAGYGPVTITKSVAIVAPEGIYAGVSVPIGADGIVIDSPGATVDLRGLTVNGAPGSRYGIWMKNGNALEIDKTRVSGMQIGLYATATDSATILRNSHFTRNSSVGIWMQDSFDIVQHTTVQRNGRGGPDDAGIRFQGYGELNLVHVESSQNVGPGIVLDDNNSLGPMKVVVDDSQFFGNVGYGIHARSNDGGFPVRVHVQRSAIVGNSDNGIYVAPLASGTATAVVSNSTISDNKQSGVWAFGGNAQIFMAGNTAHSNGIFEIRGTFVYTKGDNLIGPHGEESSMSAWPPR